MQSNSHQDDPLTSIERDPSAKGSTPGGETGIEDMRRSTDEHGKGHVRDAAGVRSPNSDRRMMPEGQLSEYPSADDPYSTPAPSEEVLEMQRADPTGKRYPSYEVNQDPEDHSTGGSVDPNDTLTHANSGDETMSSESSKEEK